MSFEVGRLSAALTLDGVDEFNRGLDNAGRKLADTGQKGSSFGRAGEAAVRAAAGATTGLVTAAGAYLAILTKTGVGYNSLQQNSRSALSVLLGGAEQANAQMGKLDDFARNSPFSKSVFIQAQQQLIGFGMEAGKVVPTLDAIQQGVAAMGGSGEQITEVVNILAKVQSTGKFTAETLNELGYRGVDAATLMGDAMGKTAAQMREDISNGAIGGAEAIEVLTTAMQDRFGGAADGVKEQWSGAVDRIKAANRDLGAHIAEPFVSAEGGGMAVTWGNQVADVLRAIEKQAVPVMGILTQRGMPFFAALTQGLDSSQQSIQRWNPDSLSVGLDKLANHAPGVAALAGATLALGAQVGPLGRMLGVLGISANPAVAAFVGLAAVSPELRDSLLGILRAGEPLLPVVADLAGVLSGSLNAALPVVSSGLDAVASVLEIVFGIIGKIPAPVLAGAAAFLAMHAASKSLNGPLSSVLGLLEQFGQRSAVQAALGETSIGMGAIATTSMAAKDGVARLGTALKTAFLSNPIGIALTVVAGAIGLWAAANANAQAKVQEHNTQVAELRGTLEGTTAALTDSTRGMVAEYAATEEFAGKLEAAGISGKVFTSSLLDGSAAAKVFNDDLMKSARSTIDAADKTEQLSKYAKTLGVSYEDLIGYGLGYSDSMDRVNSSMREATDQSGEMSNALTVSQGIMNGTLGDHLDVADAYRAQRDAITDAQAEQRRYNEAVRDAASEMSEAARSNQRLNDALAIARDVSNDAASRISALKQALDELNGGTRSQADLTRDLNEQQRNLNELFTQTDEHGNNIAASLINASGAVDTTTAAGGTLYDQLSRVNDEMVAAIESADRQAKANGDAGLSMEQAAAAAQPYRDALAAAGAAAGLSDEQIAGLIGTALEVPEIVAFALTDNGTVSETDQRILSMISSMDAIPPGETITIKDPGGPEVLQRLKDLGYEVKEIPGSKNITVTQQGADGVRSAIQSIVDTAWTAVVQVTAGGSHVSTGYTGGITRANGGLHTFNGSTPVEAFANGGFPTGIYAGGPPLIKFAEPETGWEAFISGRPGQERRNVGIAMDALNRLGFPVVPASALRGVPGFADGGMLSASPAPNSSAAVVPQRVSRRRDRTAPLAGVINIGKETKNSDLQKLTYALSRLDRRR